MLFPFCDGKQVTDAAAPSVLCPFRSRRLPHRLLIIVRKELRRQRVADRLKIGSRGRLDQWADVGNDRALLLSEQCRQRRKWGGQ